jgi:hypothetical protein
MPVPWFDPAHPLPETSDERDARLGRVSHEVEEQVRALDDATGLLRATGWGLDDFVAMAMIAAYNESSMAWEVHAGQEWPGRPSPFGDRGRARCLFQLQRTAAMVPKDEFRPFELAEHMLLAGLDDEATTRCVRAGVRALAWQAWRCRGKLAKNLAVGDRQWAVAVLYAEYHRPGACNHPTSQSLGRAFAWKTFRYRMGRLRSAG